MWELKDWDTTLVLGCFDGGGIPLRDDPQDCTTTFKIVAKFEQDVYLND